jgi:DNA cross-link repair 1A protein
MRSDAREGAPKRAASPPRATPEPKRGAQARPPLGELASNAAALPPIGADRARLRALFCAGPAAPAAAGAPAAAAAAEEASSSELGAWLAARGLGKHAACFARAGADLALLPLLSEADLEAMGVSTLGARKRVVLAARALAAPPGGAPPRARPAWPPPRAPAPAAPSLAPPAPAGGSILKFVVGADGGATRAPPRAPPPPARPVDWAHKDARTGRRGFGGGAGVRAAPQPFKPWQLVPGTSFVVDRFSSLPPATPGKRHWFLTHFHADHYKGLSGKFDRGLLYCTPPTAALARSQLRVAPARIREVPVGGEVLVEGVRVRFLEANHCPGAAMLLFEAPGRRPLLNTGDARLTRATYEGVAALEGVRGGVDLVLDTTYCAPEHAFPPQEEVLAFAVDAVRAEAFQPKTLFMFGSYTIGKERLYLEAARALGRPVYVSATKKKVLDCLGLPAELAALLTTDDGATNLHAVPLWMVTAKHMAAALKHYRGRFTSVVGFQPTGWTHERATAAAPKGRRRQKGAIITYSVPYSEHSSFAELRAFVEWLRPPTILPHVGNDGGEKERRMVALLRGAPA